MTLQELSKLYWLKREIQQIEWDIEDAERLLSAAEKNLSTEHEDLGMIGSPVISDMPKGSGSTTSLVERSVVQMMGTEDSVIRLREMLRRKKQNLAAKQLAAAEEVMKLEEYISSVGDIVVRRIMHLRFIQGLRWDEVARQMGRYEPDTVKKMCYRYLKSQAS